MHQLLFGFCMSMMLWMFGTSMMFSLRNQPEIAVFWDRIVYFGVVFMPPLMHHFSLLFTGQMGKQKKLLVLNYLLAFFFLFSSVTKYFVDDLYYYWWGVHSQARILHTIFLGYFFVGTGLFFVNLWRYYRKLKERALRVQVSYVFLAFAIVIFIGGSAYLFAYGIDTKFPFSYFSGLIFPVMLFYTVTRHHMLGLKVVLTEVFAGLTNSLVILQIFLSVTPMEIFLRVIFAILIAILSILLVRSVNKEVERREEVSRLADSLETANAKLQELDKQKTEFLSIASHQLRTPLTVLKGYVELMQDGAYGKIGRELRKILKNLDSNNEHLIKLVDDFLDISRIEQGRTKFVFKPADLNKVLASAVEELREKALKKGLKITRQPEVSLKKFSFDEDKVRHVILNFVDNAVKYSDRGKITITTAKENGGVTLRVKDQGIGFDKVDEVNFYQKFFRGDNVKTIDVGGTGLGLYVCRKFVEAHQGRVWAKSRGLGQGSEFGFWVPLRQRTPVDK